MYVYIYIQLIICVEYIDIYMYIYRSYHIIYQWNNIHVYISMALVCIVCIFVMSINIHHVFSCVCNGIEFRMSCVCVYIYMVPQNGWLVNG